MIHEFKNPIPVIVESNKVGYAIYVRDGATFENDIWCVALCDGGIIRHYRSDQLKMHANSTFDIIKKMKKLYRKIFGTRKMLHKKDKIFFFVVFPLVSFIMYAINFSFYD